MGSTLTEIAPFDPRQEKGNAMSNKKIVLEAITTLRSTRPSWPK
jgi:hypothetical protein